MTGLTRQVEVVDTSVCAFDAAPGGDGLLLVHGEGEHGLVQSPRADLGLLRDLATEHGDSYAKKFANLRLRGAVLADGRGQPRVTLGTVPPNVMGWSPAGPIVCDPACRLVDARTGAAVALPLDVVHVGWDLIVARNGRDLDVLRIID